MLGCCFPKHQALTMSLQNFMTFLVWFTLILLFIVYPITLAYGCYKLHQNHYKQYFIHRNIPLLIAMISSLTIFVYIGVLPGYLVYACGITFIQDENLQYSIIFLNGYALAILHLIVMSLRCFDLAIKIVHSQNNKKWKQLLNPNYNKDSFISNYYHILSHPKYQLLSASIFFIIGFGAICANFFLTGMQQMQIYVGPAILTAIVALYVAICLHKIVPFADFWFIRTELLLMCSGVISIIPVQLILILIHLDTREQIKILSTSSGLYLVLVVFVCFRSHVLHILYINQFTNTLHTYDTSKSYK